MLIVCLRLSYACGTSVHMRRKLSRHDERRGNDGVSPRRAAGKCCFQIRRGFSPQHRINAGCNCTTARRSLRTSRFGQSVSKNQSRCYYRLLGPVCALAKKVSFLNRQSSYSFPVFFIFNRCVVFEWKLYVNIRFDDDNAPFEIRINVLYVMVFHDRIHGITTSLCK